MQYLVVNYSSWLVSFYSAGIVDLLYPVKSGPTGQGSIVGTDVFKFLTKHSSAGLGRDYKSRVKTAMKAGSAISLDLGLCTRRYMGFEKFVIHWTPLKDERGDVGFLVLTLSSLQ